MFVVFSKFFFNSDATTFIVAKGVPRECFAAAACPPKTLIRTLYAITS